MVVADEDVESLVDAGRVLELLVRVPGRQRRNRRVESRGVSQRSVLVACGERAGYAAHRAAVGDLGAADRLAAALLLGAHLARGVDLGPDDVTVHVDSAGHHHQPAGIEDARRLDLGIGGRLDDLPAGDPDVAHLAVDFVGRVVDGSPGDLEVLGDHRSLWPFRQSAVDPRFRAGFVSSLASRPRPCRARPDRHGKAADRFRAALSPPGNRNRAQLTKEEAEKKRLETAGAPERGQQRDRFRAEEPKRPSLHAGAGPDAAAPKHQDGAGDHAESRRVAAGSPHGQQPARRLAAPISWPTLPPIRMVPSVMPRLLPR